MQNCQQHRYPRFADQTVYGVADSTGNWKIMLAPLTAEK